MIFDFNIPDNSYQTYNRAPQYISARSTHHAQPKDKEEIKEEIKEETRERKDNIEEKKDNTIESIKSDTAELRESTISGLKSDFKNALLYSLGVGVIIGSSVAIYKNRKELKLQSIQPDISIINGQGEYKLKATFIY